MIDLQTQPSLAAQRSGGVWDYISASRLNLWLRCPLAFRLRYIDGIRTPTSPSLFLGKQVHHGLEVLSRHKQLGIPISADDVVRQMLDAWDQAVAEDDMRFRDPKEEPTLRDKAASLVRAYIDCRLGGFSFGMRSRRNPLAFLGHRVRVVVQLVDDALDRFLPCLQCRDPIAHAAGHTVDPTAGMTFSRSIRLAKVFALDSEPRSAMCQGNFDGVWLKEIAASCLEAGDAPVVGFDLEPLLCHTKSPCHVWQRKKMIRHLSVSNSSSGSGCIGTEKV